MGRAQVTTFCFLLRLDVRNQVTAYGCAPMVTTPVGRVLAWWQRQRGESLRPPKTSSCPFCQSRHLTIALLCLCTTASSLRSTWHIHAALAFGGPRWQSLNLTVSTSYCRDANWSEYPGSSSNSNGSRELWLEDSGTCPSTVGPVGSSGGVAATIFVQRWILNYCFLYSFQYYLDYLVSCSSLFTLFRKLAFFNFKCFMLVFSLRCSCFFTNCPFRN